MRLVVLIAVMVALAAAPAVGGGRCGPDACRADVSVSGHAEPQPIRVGETSELKVTPKNNGVDGALKIDLQITVADGLRVLGLKRYGGNSCTRKGQFIRCDMGDFKREQEGVVVVKVKGPKRGFFISRAKVYSSGVVDKNRGNNSVRMTIGVLPRP